MSQNIQALRSSQSIAKPSLSHREEPQLRKRTSDGSQPFAEVFRSMAEKGQRGQQAMRQAMSGQKDYSGAELLVLQSKVYQYVEVVDLVSKLAEKSTSGLKQILQQS